VAGFRNVFDNIGAWDALDDNTRARIRYVMVAHEDDGVVLFGPEMLLRAPEWLGPPDTRPSRVPKGMRWLPTTGFLQGLIDMKNSATVTPGQFAAKGHDYRLDLVPFFNAVLGFAAPPEVIEKIVERLELQELTRSRWIQSHEDAGSSLAAAVAIQWMDAERAAGRDPDVALEQAFESLIEQLQTPDSAES